MAYCGQHSLSSGDRHQKVCVTLRCRAWTCPDCVTTRKSQLIAEAIGGAPTTFLTLTIRRQPGLTTYEAAKRLSRAWRLVRLRALRKYGWRKLPFFAVFEPHQSGWPHMHILARCGYIAHAWLSAQMSELIDSPIVHIVKIDNPGRASGYVAKYCGKGTEKFGSCKRYWQSPDYDLRPEPAPKEKPKPGYGWERETMTLAQWITTFTTFGWTVHRPSAHRAEARAPP